LLVVGLFNALENARVGAGLYVWCRHATTHERVGKDEKNLTVLYATHSPVRNISQDYLRSFARRENNRWGRLRLGSMTVAARLADKRRAFI
jgi:hypothetical protein